MIHYITVAVALERPPTPQEYRRYAIYGGTHADAELVALQMAACTSVMPVEVVKDGDVGYGSRCALGACRVAEKEPHGAMGCRCWPRTDVEGGWHEEEAWLVGDACPLHGRVARYTDTTPVGPVTTPPGGPSPTVPPATDDTPVGDIVTRGLMSAWQCPGCGDEHGGMHMLCSDCGVNGRDEGPPRAGSTRYSDTTEKKERGVLSAVKRRIRQWRRGSGCCD